MMYFEQQRQHRERGSSDSDGGFDQWGRYAYVFIYLPHSRAEHTAEQQHSRAAQRAAVLLLLLLCSAVGYCRSY